MQRPANIKDKTVLAYIEFIESKLEVFTKSPYSASYVALKRLLDKGNKQLLDSANAEEDIDFESKEFTAISTFITKQKVYLKDLKEYRDQMTPMEQKDVDALMRKGAGIAEKVAMKKKDARG